MKTCLFWVNRKNTDKQIIVPVFDVLEGINAQFLVYEDNQFYYEIADNYEPLTTDWDDAMHRGLEK